MTRPHQTIFDRTKRFGDVVGSALALVVTAPVQAVIAVAVAVKLGRPVIFVQRRTGLEGRPFSLYKFRTMQQVDPSKGLIDDADRLGRFGRWLRGTSLDELPTLVNVLKGDMSFVGPRPLLVHYLDRYSAHQARRHEVRPGITGLAQIRGRNALPWGEKLTLDVEYVDSRSFTRDLQIALASIGVVLRGNGVAAANRATVDEFMGDGQCGS
jgi:lipopolysaccharide/colanic/teichoic acid biosynthesis glycosyltransferase